MKKSVKKFFLLGIAVGAAGYLAAHTKKVRSAVKDLVKKKKLKKHEAEKLTFELLSEVEKLGKKAKKAVKKAKPKVRKAVKKARPKFKKTIKKVRKAVTVKTRFRCSTCGTMSKSNAKFCRDCGTYLE